MPQYITCSRCQYWHYHWEAQRNDWKCLKCSAKLTSKADRRRRGDRERGDRSQSRPRDDRSTPRGSHVGSGRSDGSGGSPALSPQEQANQLAAQLRELAAKPGVVIEGIEVSPLQTPDVEPPSPEKAWRKANADFLQGQRKQLRLAGEVSSLAKQLEERREEARGHQEELNKLADAAVAASRAYAAAPSAKQKEKEKEAKEETKETEGMQVDGSAADSSKGGRSKRSKPLPSDQERQVWTAVQTAVQAAAAGVLPNASGPAKPWHEQPAIQTALTNVLTYMSQQAPAPVPSSPTETEESPSKASRRSPEEEAIRSQLAQVTAQSDELLLGKQAVAPTVSPAGAEDPLGR